MLWKQIGEAMKIRKRYFIWFPVTLTLEIVCLFFRFTCICKLIFILQTLPHQSLKWSCTRCPSLARKQTKKWILRLGYACFHAGGTDTNMCRASIKKHYVASTPKFYVSFLLLSQKQGTCCCMLVLSGHRDQSTSPKRLTLELLKF